MATIANPIFEPETSGRDAGGPRRVLLEGISWQTYQTLLSEIGERHIRLTFDHGSLEIRRPQSDLFDPYSSRELCTGQHQPGVSKATFDMDGLAAGPWACARAIGRGKGIERAVKVAVATCFTTTRRPGNYFSDFICISFQAARLRFVDRSAA